jgi:hypothetical protein
MHKLDRMHQVDKVEKMQKQTQVNMSSRFLYEFMSSNATSIH